MKFALSSIRVAAVIGIIGTLVVMFTGDMSGIHAAKYQPMKLAAAEGLMDGGTKAPFSIVPGVEIPGMLSILATHDIDGYVPGINNLLDGYRNGCDDYIVKPFPMSVLAEKCNVLINRHNGNKLQKELSCCGIVLDKNKATVSVCGDEISLSYKSFHLFLSSIF